MSTLHIFSKPLSHYCINTLENLIDSNHAVLLVGDACYNINQFKQFSATLHLLEEDAIARAISLNESDIHISYAEFVELTLSAQNTITW
ncbi:DsrH/TusB family sulfur relay protein [Pseudoalteromonas sp. CF6-2]|uniref:DsrH/TusB family sulfur relay protein n=1 Tax=unclassified Pseudoalteromonas TaxID=194690 RepID=UPI0018817BAF|nr:DsrH/TusB family sulfur metabolism protein [Lelliottia steviae]UJX27009.1 DsrH/TusB family sulfur relay protein [Pseudoalteromonas sp. CF6-2]